MKQPRRARHAATKKSFKETNPKNAKKSKKNKIRRSRTALLIFIIFIAAIGICIGCDFTKTADEPEDNSIVPLDIKDGKINVLLLGVDIEGLRTDAMMVASYDINENKVNLLSIPRDTRMYVGTRYQKINAAHAIGGMTGKIAGPEGSVEAVTRITGIPIHYYLEFSFGAIDNFINALGGVDFDVPDVEGKGRGMNYDDPVQDLHIHLEPGMQHLNGNQVQQLLRYRKSNTSGLGYADGDRGRVEMQQKFLRELVDQKITPANLLKIPEIITSIKEGIKTNMTVADMTKYAKYFKNFSSENITAYQLPGEGKSMTEGSGTTMVSYWICDLDETKTLIETVFGYDASKITIDAPEGTSKTQNNKSNSDDKDSKSGKSNKETSSSNSSNSKSTDSAKTTKKPETVHEEIPDNSDEEDYTASKVKITNPPMPTKAVQKGADAASSKTDSIEKSDNKSPSDTPKTPQPKEDVQQKSENTANDKTPSQNKTDSSDTKDTKDTKDTDKKNEDIKTTEKKNNSDDDDKSGKTDNTEQSVSSSKNSGTEKKSDSEKSDSETKKADSTVINLE